MQEEQGVGRFAGFPRGLHRCVDFPEEPLPFPPLHALEAQAVVAQVETEQAAPEARAGLAEAVRFRYVHERAAESGAVVALAGEAVARRLAVGAEPYRIDHAGGGGGRAAAFQIEHVQAEGARGGLGPIQFREQGADLALDTGAVGGFSGEALQDLLFELCGVDAIPGADGGCEFREQVGERSLRVGGGRHGDGTPVDLLLFQRRLPDLFENLVHIGLQFGNIHLALAKPLSQRVKGRVGQQFGHAGHGQLGTGGTGAAEADDVVGQRILAEVLPQPGDEAVNEGGELVAGRFGEIGRGTVVIEAVGQVVVQNGAVAGIGQLLAKGEGAALLGDGLGHVALSGEQVGKGAEHLGAPGRIVLEQGKASFQFRPGLGEAARQLHQHVGPVEAINSDFLFRPFQCSPNRHHSVQPAQSGGQILSGRVGLPGDVERTDVDTGE